jgi:hypothetical protein
VVVMLSAGLFLLWRSDNRWHDWVSQRLDVSFTQITEALRWMFNAGKKSVEHFHLQVNCSWK